MKLFVFVIISSVMTLYGCSKSSMRHVEIYAKTGDAYRASIHLERCAKNGLIGKVTTTKKQKECIELLEKIETVGTTPDQYFRDIYNVAEAAKKRKLELERLEEMRNSQNPWELLTLATEISNNKIDEKYTGESFDIFKKSFFLFGDCAKESDHNCMTQYAKMILIGIEDIDENSKKLAEKNAVYWLNIAARYGNTEARKHLIILEKDIPTPDLAMEQLQKEANNIAKDTVDSQRELAHKQYLLLLEQQETKSRQEYANMMRSFFPKTVNCTSNRIGSTTYTNCW